MGSQGIWRDLLTLAKFKLHSITCPLLKPGQLLIFGGVLQEGTGAVSLGNALPKWPYVHMYHMSAKRDTPIANGPCCLPIYLLKMVIGHSYVSLPDGILWRVYPLEVHFMSKSPVVYR